MDALDSQIQAAHAARDFTRLAELYERAADGANCVDAECFFLTAAYVYALDAGSDRANRLWQRLNAHGREE